ncbi:NAD-dependent epimerase/dehydratase family protein [Conchiformibius steedae]|uniref:NAD(P)-dependent oxidoreductase n=1 Tax=Conchiformibius steedae TaxID=153493 RepID=A0A3P2A8Q3_9NEIS|nr:NAD(P)-dependent oxidoreductase [Conchiformibius steedae]RRD89983.1 NAD(P)-dependent oxidoreductase [Conchiformibius steedae]
MTFDYPVPAAFVQALQALKSRRILVTGATSGLGRCAVDYLHDAGISCVATGRNPEVIRELNALGMTTQALDLASASSAELEQLLEGIDTVWHCAALSSPWGAYQDFYAANVCATQKLATAAHASGVQKFIHISTPSVYFNFSHRHNVREDDCSLNANSRFVNHYIQTKFLAEQFLQQLHSPMSVVMLRPRAIFGRYDRVLLPKILNLYHQKKGKLPLPNGGKVWMDVTFADNVVYAMTLATTAKALDEAPISIFNISNQEPISLCALLHQLICRELGKPLHIKNVPYALVAALARTAEALSVFHRQAPPLTAYSAGVLYYDMTLNTQRATQILDYHAVYPLDTAIKLSAQYL